MTQNNVKPELSLRRHLPKLFILLFLLFSAFCLLIQYGTGGFQAERGNHSDEAAHFVSSIAISDYLHSNFEKNPISFAKDYYAHFPKVAIGHWPPFFEFLQALVFYFFGASATSAIVLQAAIGGLCLALTSTVALLVVGRLEAFLASVIVLASPTFLGQLNMVMADSLLGFVVTLTALAWSNFVAKRTWLSSFAFAVAASVAILTKGSAIGLLLLPLIYCLLKRQLTFLLNIKTIISAAIVAALTVPWYLMTYQMAADGFVYKWGWDYTKLAAPAFAEGLFLSVGWPVTTLFILGAFVVSRFPVEKGPFKKPNEIYSLTAAAISMFVFLVIAPADLDKRYLISILPSVGIVSVWAFSRFIRDHFTSRQNYAPALIIIAIVFFSAYENFSMPHPRSFHAKEIVNEILLRAQQNRLVLISGGVQAEGAFISEFATRSAGSSFYVIRAQKALATTNWMASAYNPKFSSASALGDWLTTSQIGWIVRDEDSDESDFPHNLLLKEAIDSGKIGAKLCASAFHPGGQMDLYSLPASSMSPIISDKVLSTFEPGHLGGVIK